MENGIIWLIVVAMAGIALGLLAIKQFERIKSLEESCLDYMREAEFWHDQNNQRIDEKIQLARAVVDGRVDKYDIIRTDKSTGRKYKETRVEFNGNRCVAYRQNLRKNYNKEAKAQ